MAALAMAWTIETKAQEAFSDVPQTHWAYQAVNELQKKKILRGYPDCRFNGQRPLTRYEFAVALKRVLESIQAVPGKEQANIMGAPGEKGAAGPQGEAGSRGDMGPSGLTAAQTADLAKLTDLFQTELKVIGVDTKQALTRLSVLDKSVDAINERLDRMIRFNGDFFTGVRTDGSRFAFDDYSGPCAFRTTPSLSRLILPTTSISRPRLNCPTA